MGGRQAIVLSCESCLNGASARGLPEFACGWMCLTIITCLSSVWHCQAIAVVPRYYFVEGGANLLIGILVIVCLHVF